jgi:hypothetical protein
MLWDSTWPMRSPSLVSIALSWCQLLKGDSWSNGKVGDFVVCLYGHSLWL